MPICSHWRALAEGIPVALMEAMSLGIPCVSTYIAGIPELIRSGVDGLLVPAANAVALANALEIVIGDPLLRRSLVHRPGNVSSINTSFR